LTAVALAVVAAVLLMAGGQRAEAFPASKTTIGPNTFSCADVSEIPQTECEALVTLYNDTNGPGWTHNAGWLGTNMPCFGWNGVGCTAGHVTQLSLGSNQLSGAIPQSLKNVHLIYFNWVHSKLVPGILSGARRTRSTALPGRQPAPCVVEGGDFG
jgi:hypothetical protein